MNTSTKVLLSSACLFLAACGSNTAPQAHNSLQHNGKSYLLCPSPKMIRFQVQHNHGHWTAEHSSVWAIINHTNRPLPEFSEDHKIRLMFAEVGHNRALCRYTGITESGRKAFIEAQLQPHAFAKVTTAGNNWRNCSQQQRCSKVCYAVRTDVCPFSLNAAGTSSAKSVSSVAHTRVAALGH